MESTANLLDLVDEAAQIPHTGISRVLTAARSQLVVVVILHTGGRKETVHGLKEVVRPARAAVQQQHLQSGIVADSLRPHLERAQWRRNRDHPHATRSGIRTVRSVEVLLVHGAPMCSR